MIIGGAVMTRIEDTADISMLLGADGRIVSVLVNPHHQTLGRFPTGSESWCKRCCPTSVSSGMCAGSAYGMRSGMELVGLLSKGGAGSGRVIMNKKLVRARPLAHIRIGWKNLAHLMRLVPTGYT